MADRHQGTVVLKKQEDFSTKAKQVTQNIYEGASAQEKRSRMRMLLNFNTATLEAFFAKRVILVEGDCEVASITAIKNKLKEIRPEIGDDLERILRDVSIIPCNGKLTQKAYYEVLNFSDIQAYLIHDLDNMELDEGSNLNILDTFGSEEFRYTHQPNFEEDIFGEHWERDKPWKASKLIDENFETHHEKLHGFFKFVLGEEKFDSLTIDSLLETIVS